MGGKRERAELQPLGNFLIPSSKPEILETVHGRTPTADNDGRQLFTIASGNRPKPGEEVLSCE